MRRSDPRNPLNGRMSLGTEGCVSLRKCAYTDVSQSYEDAIPQKNSNYWSSTENSSNNAWNVNFNSGSVNNNNKYNGLVARAVSAYHGCNCEEYERLLGNRTFARFTERCEGFRRLMESRPMNSIDIKRIETVINSYMGFCKGRETYRKRRKIIDGMGEIFWRYFYVKGRYKSIRAKRKYRLPCLTPFSCAAA